MAAVDQLLGGWGEDMSCSPSPPLSSCPGCGSLLLSAHSSRGRVNYVCHQCGSWWHVSLGYVYKVPGQSPAPQPGTAA
jgi:hypothetical protein